MDRSNMLTKNENTTARKFKKEPKVLIGTLFAFWTLLFFVWIYYLISNDITIPGIRKFEKSISVNKTFLPEIKSQVSERNDTVVAMINKIFEVKMIPGLQTLINPTKQKYALAVNGSYLIENKNLCSDEKYVTLLVMILSATNNFQRRNAIRETWGNSNYYLNNGTVKILFLLGLTKLSSVQQQIGLEFERYKDILQGDFIDSYENVSYKSVMAFKWLTERCLNAKYILKTDDDVVINIFHIFENVIPNIALDQYHVHCERRHNSGIVRQRHAKSYVEPHQLKGRRNHMPYCHGQYVLFLNDIVPYLYKSASITPFLWIDDVFNYGIVMNNIPGLKYKQVQPSEYEPYRTMKIPLCFTERSSLCRHLYIVAEQEKQIKIIWSSLKIQYGKC